MIALLLSLSLCAGADLKASTKRAFDEGVQRLKEGKADDAVAAFKRAAAFDPHEAAARYNLGVLAVKRGQWSEAAKWLREYEQVAPRSPRLPAVIALRQRAEQLAPVEKNAVALKALRYDELLQLVSDPSLDAAALAAVVKKADEIDASRWQVPALAGNALIARGAWQQGCRYVQAAAERGGPPSLAEAGKLCRTGVERENAEAAVAKAFTAGDPKARELAAPLVSLGSTDWDVLWQAALVNGERSDWAAAKALTDRLQAAAPKAEAQRAAWLAEQFARMQKLEERAEQAKGQTPQGGLPATQLPQLLQQIDQWAQAADATANQTIAFAEERARRKQEQVRQLEDHLRELQDDFQTQSDYAARAERDAADYASGKYGIGGTVAAGMSRQNASEYRAKANEIQQNMLTTERLLEGARRALAEDQ